MKKGFKLLTYFARICGISLLCISWDIGATGNWIPLLPGVTLGDESYERFVSRYVPLTDARYVPSDLEALSGSLAIDTAGRGVDLRREARDSLWLLSGDFAREFGRPLVVVSGYRSAAYQQRLWDQGRCSDALCARPGYSEHQLGLAIDIFEATTERDILANRAFTRYIAWMREHAHEYGWHEGYQRGEDIDGYSPEPWHWRYIGIPLATKLKNLDLTLTEYVRLEHTLGYLGFGGVERGYLRFIP